MKVLVVLFALLGILGTCGLGAIVTSVLAEDAKKGENTLGAITKNLRSVTKQVRDNDDLDDVEKKELITALEGGKDTMKNIEALPIVYFASGGLGLLMMILCLANVGPKAVSAVGLLLAGALPPLASWWTMRTFAAFLEAAAKVDSSGTKFPKDMATTVLLATAAVGGGFVLAGTLGFFVKRKANSTAGSPPAAVVPGHGA